MRHRGLREVKTFGNLGDGRRTRTVHGAYLELAALALQRQRLVQERRSAAARTQEIDECIAAMNRQSAVLLRYIEHPDPAILEALAARPLPLRNPDSGIADLPGGRNELAGRSAASGAPSAGQGGRAFRQKALHY